MTDRGSFFRGTVGEGAGLAEVAEGLAVEHLAILIPDENKAYRGRFSARV